MINDTFKLYISVRRTHYTIDYLRLLVLDTIGCLLFLLLHLLFCFSLSFSTTSRLTPSYDRTAYFSMYVNFPFLQLLLLSSPSSSSGRIISFVHVRYAQYYNYLSYICKKNSSSREARLHLYSRRFYVSASQHLIYICNMHDDWRLLLLLMFGMTDVYLLLLGCWWRKIDDDDSEHMIKKKSA